MWYDVVCCDLEYMWFVVVEKWATPTSQPRASGHERHIYLKACWARGTLELCAVNIGSVVLCTFCQLVHKATPDRDFAIKYHSIC